MTTAAFPSVTLDYGGLRWTVDYGSVNMTVKAKHPAMEGFAFEKRFACYPGVMSENGRRDASSKAIHDAARSLGLKVED